MSIDPPIQVKRSKADRNPNVQTRDGVRLKQPHNRGTNH